MKVMKKILSLFVLIAPLMLMAQQPSPVTTVVPCIVPFTFSNTGSVPSTTGYDNRQSGCTNWNVFYNSSGFSAISLELQSAVSGSNTPPGTPGSYVTFAGTLVSGSNPNTAITSATSTFSGYYPWIRLRLGSVTGTGIITGVLIGTLPISATGGGSTGGGCTAPCVVIGPDATGVAPTQNPVQISGFDGVDVRRIATDVNGGVAGASDNPTFSNGKGLTQSQPIDANGNTMYTPVVPYVYNGLTLDMQFACGSSVAINTSSSGATELVPISGVKIVKICNINWASASPVTVTLVYGSGSNCGTGTTSLTGAYPSITTFADNFFGSLKTPIAKAVCISLGSAVSTQGVLTYGYVN